jgi:hypothetical protein
MEIEIFDDDGYTEFWSELEYDVVATLRTSESSIPVSEMECCKGLNINRWQDLDIAFPMIGKMRLTAFVPYGFKLRLYTQYQGGNDGK